MFGCLFDKLRTAMSARAGRLLFDQLSGCFDFVVVVLSVALSVWQVRSISVVKSSGQNQ